MEKVEILPSSVSNRLDERVNRGGEKLWGVAKHDIRTPLYLEVLLHVLTDHFKFAVLNVKKLVNNQIKVIFAKVVENQKNLVINRPL